MYNNEIKHLPYTCSVKIFQSTVICTVCYTCIKKIVCSCLCSLYMIESEKTFRVDNISFFIIFMIIIEHLMIYRMHFELSEVKLFVF